MVSNSGCVKRSNIAPQNIGSQEIITEMNANKIAVAKNEAYNAFTPNLIGPPMSKCKKVSW